MGAEPQPGIACPDDEMLALLVDGSLDPHEDAAVRAHLDACDDCRVLFADVARALDSGVGPRAVGARRPGELSFHKGDLLAQKYRIERLLGKGGMGEVFAARHVELNKMVALKVMRADMTKDADAVKRFAREAKAAASLRSEHAVRILDVGKIDDSIPFIVMEHLEGHDLGSLAQGEILPIADAVHYMRQACDALADAHAVGIIHRDLKPHNLFLTRDARGEPFIKVLDFGLAKARADWKSGPQDSSNTATNVMLGSPFFMSPEQVESPKHVDHRTDIWSLGATLYQLVCGTPPFLAPNVHIVCARILTEDFPPARTKRPEVPKELEEIFRRSMNRDLAARYQSVTELGRALDSLLARLDEAEERAPSSAPTNALGRFRAPISSEAATVARGPRRFATPDGENLEASTRPIEATSLASVELVPDDEPTLGEAWRAASWGRPLSSDDTTTTTEVIAPTRASPQAEIITLHPPTVVTAPPTVTSPQAELAPPTAVASSVKDTIPERPPPMTTPFEMPVPRISTLPMPAATAKAPSAPPRSRTRLVLGLLGVLAAGAAIAAFALRRQEPTTAISSPADTATSAATTIATPATTTLPVSSSPALPSSTTVIATSAPAKPSTPAKPVATNAPTPKKPPSKPAHPVGSGDPYAAP